MIGITTCLRPEEKVVALAKTRAMELGVPCLIRDGSLWQMAEKHSLEGFLVYGAKSYFWIAGETYAFHLGTAALRILQMKRGAADRLCRHVSIRPGMRILDCTFGQGGDSVVLSWYAGQAGQVVSLEKSKALYEMGRMGLAGFSDAPLDVVAALRRITLINEDFHAFLRKQPEGSFDYIYFDTMFAYPVKREQNRREGFRRAACYDSLDEDALHEACRVSSCKVIVKERPFSRIFKSPLFTEIQVHPGQSTAYGVIQVCRGKSLSLY